MSIAQKHYQVGYSLYMGGHSLRTCQNEWQRKGWWDAQSGELAAADCETEAYLEWIADQDYHRSGNW